MTDDGKAKVFHCHQSISAVIFMNVPASVAALEAFPIMEKALVFLFVVVQVSCEIVNQISVVKKRHFEITHIFDPPKCFLKAFRHD